MGNLNVTFTQIEYSQIKANAYIIGRQFQYDRALEIIQDEEYLEDADEDEIKRSDNVRKIIKPNLEFKNPKHVYYGEWNALQNQQIHFKRDNYHRKETQLKFFSQKNKAENYENHLNKNKKKYKGRRRVKRQTGNQ